MEELRDKKRVIEQLEGDLAAALKALQAVEVKAAAYLEDLRRLQTEHESYRQQVEKNKLLHRNTGKEAVLRHVVSLLDVLEAAQPSAHIIDRRSLSQGLNLLFQEFRKFLAEEGLEEIVPMAGDVLDPDFHRVVGGERQDAAHKIASVMRKGYRYNGTVLRMAHVTVKAGDSRASR